MRLGKMKFARRWENELPNSKEELNSFSIYENCPEVGISQEDIEKTQFGKR